MGIMTRNTGLKTSHIPRTTQSRTAVSTPSGAILPKPEKVSFQRSVYRGSRPEFTSGRDSGGLTEALTNRKTGYAPDLLNQQMNVCFVKGRGC